MAAIASTSSSSSLSTEKPSLQLLDLHPDILLKIFSFIPLHDKLHTLIKMPEFHHLLKYRGSYLSSKAPFSYEYICFLRRLRTGWYISRSNWSHCFCLKIHETTLHFSLYHFLLEGFEGYFKPNSRCNFFSETIDRMQMNLDLFFVEYIHIDDMKLLLYYLKGFGFIMINHAFPNNQQVMRFYDSTVWMIEINKKLEMWDTRDLYSHFIVTLTSDKKLLVECTLPVNFCICEEKFQELSPFSFQAVKGYKALTWDGGKNIPLVGHQEFRLGKDECHIKSGMMYHMDYPFKNTLEVEKRAKRNAKLKRLLMIDDDKEEEQNIPAKKSFK